MNYKKFGLFIAIASSIIILGIFAILPLSGCKEPCCPRGTKEAMTFTCYPWWICSGQTANLYVKVTFYNESGNLCKPSDAWLFSLTNKTDPEYNQKYNYNNLLNEHWDWTATGVKETEPEGFPMPHPIDHNTEMYLVIGGDVGCESAKRYCTIRVVDPSYNYQAIGYNKILGQPFYWPDPNYHLPLRDLKIPNEMLPSHYLKIQDELGEPGPWMEIPVDIFGENVLVDYIKNLHNHEIEVSFHGISITIPSQGTSTEYRNLHPNDIWRLRVDKSIYDNGDLFFIWIYLKC